MARNPGFGASWVIGGVTVALCVACSHNEPQPLVPASREQTPEPRELQYPKPAADAPSREAEERETPDPGREGTLGLSPGIQKRCRLPETRAGSPQFDFDESELRPRGMNILDGVVTCMQDGGPLSGESISIVGHADPRGPNDYNRGLGMRRAEAARRYLTSKGVPESRVTVRSRGEADAKGTDPASWQLDRHVEIEEATGVGR